MPSCRTAPWPGRRNTAKALPICNRRYGRLAICATLNGYRRGATVEGFGHLLSGLLQQLASAPHPVALAAPLNTIAKEGERPDRGAQQILNRHQPKESPVRMCARQLRLETHGREKPGQPDREH